MNDEERGRERERRKLLPTSIVDYSYCVVENYRLNKSEMIEKECCVCVCVCVLLARTNKYRMAKQRLLFCSATRQDYMWYAHMKLNVSKNRCFLIFNCDLYSRVVRYSKKKSGLRNNLCGMDG